MLASPSSLEIHLRPRFGGGFFCVSPVLGETNFAAPRSVGGFAAGVEPSGPLSSGGGRLPINERAMSNTERQRRHLERVRNDPTRATSKLWFEEAERVAAGLWVMTWIARQRGIDTASLTELMDKFQDVANVLYDQMWPDLPVRDDSHETIGS